MKFESVKCDCCGRIQDGANHWLQMAAHYSYMKSESATPFSEMTPSLIALGAVTDNLILGHSAALAGMKETNVILDLCGQGCALKHIARLLGWDKMQGVSE